jgi:hypothetical protein
VVEPVLLICSYPKRIYVPTGKEIKRLMTIIMQWLTKPKPNRIYYEINIKEIDLQYYVFIIMTTVYF